MVASGYTFRDAASSVLCMTSVLSYQHIYHPLHQEHYSLFPVLLGQFIIINRFEFIYLVYLI